MTTPRCERPFFLLPHFPRNSPVLLLLSNRYKQEVTATHKVSIKYFGLRTSQLLWLHTEWLFLFFPIYMRRKEAKMKHYELTTIPILCPCTAQGEQVEKLGVELSPENGRGREKIFRFVLICHYPTLIWLLIS